MKSITHNIFTECIIELYDIRLDESRIIIKNDISQDNLLKNINHYGEKARDIFDETYLQYNYESTPEELGKLMHFLLDMATPPHMEGGKRIDRLLVHSTFEDISSKIITKDKILNELKTAQPISDLDKSIDELMGFQITTLNIFIDSIIKKPKSKPVEPIEISMWDIIKLLSGNEKTIKKMLAKVFGKKDDWSDDEMRDTLLEFVPRMIEILKETPSEEKKNIRDLIIIIDELREKIITTEATERPYYSIKYGLYLQILYEKINKRIIEITVPIALFLFNRKYKKKKQ